jgi:hypothetical protein
MLAATPGGLLLESASEVAQQPFGLVRVVEFPRLPQRLAHRGTQRLRDRSSEFS